MCSRHILRMLATNSNVGHQSHRSSLVSKFQPAIGNRFEISRTLFAALSLLSLFCAMWFSAVSDNKEEEEGGKKSSPNKPPASLLSSTAAGAKPPSASSQLPPLHFVSRRSPIYATKACVATSQPLATSIGLHILRGCGGNAADASVAVAAALAVVGYIL